MKIEHFPTPFEYTPSPKPHKDILGKEMTDKCL